jgi:hypothetical protein
MPRSVRIQKFGNADVLQIEDVMVGEPGAGEVRLRIHASQDRRTAEPRRRSRHIDRRAGRRSGGQAPHRRQGCRSSAALSGAPHILSRAVRAST